jgi:hypothetical protein
MFLSARQGLTRGAKCAGDYYDIWYREDDILFAFVRVRLNINSRWGDEI